MRDLLSKLDAIVSETALNTQDPKGDYEAKKQALDDLESDPVAAKDPDISSAIDQRRSDLDKEAKAAGVFEVGDSFGISFSEDFEIGTEIVGFVEDGIVIELDDHALEMLANEGLTFLEGEIVNEEKQKGVDGKVCWKGYKRMGTKQKGGKTVDNCVKMGEDSDIEESGLQYYTGVKKHGKEYMTKAAAAGREGASQKELGALKDKYSKAHKGKAKNEGVAEGGLEANTPNPVVVIQDLKGKILDKVNLSVAAQKYKLGDPQDIKKQLAHQNYTTIGNYVVVAPMTGQPQDATKEDHGPENPDADYNQGEYDREGDMAKDQLRTIDSAAEELYAIISANENLPEWVQKKITLAMDYIDTARDYLKSNKYAENAQTNEAEYRGRNVPLGKKMAGDVKKSKVYVRKPNGNIVKVNFGDKKMRIKKSNPARRKSFRARHNCKNPGPRWKARYWSCRSW
jgi:hypothetical protein